MVLTVDTRDDNDTWPLGASTCCRYALGCHTVYTNHHQAVAVNILNSAQNQLPANVCLQRAAQVVTESSFVSH
jgi:hypothetical protein